MKKLLLGLTLLLSVSSFAVDSKKQTYEVQAGDKIVLMHVNIGVTDLRSATQQLDYAKKQLTVKCHEIDGDLVGPMKTSNGVLEETLREAIENGYAPNPPEYFSICKF